MFFFHGIMKIYMPVSATICNYKGKSSQTAPLAIKNAKEFYHSKSLLRIIWRLFTESLIGSDFWKSVVQPPAWSRTTTGNARGDQLSAAESWKPPRTEIPQYFWILVLMWHHILVRRFYYHITAPISFYCIHLQVLGFQEHCIC